MDASRLLHLYFPRRLSKPLPFRCPAFSRAATMPYATRSSYAAVFYSCVSTAFCRCDCTAAYREGLYLYRSLFSGESDRGWSVCQRAIWPDSTPGGCGGLEPPISSRDEPITTQADCLHCGGGAPTIRFSPRVIRVIETSGGGISCPMGPVFAPDHAGRTTGETFAYSLYGH